MVGRGRYHLSTQKLKNWVLSDVKSYFNLNQVDNTSDLMKPVSLAQGAFINSKVKNIRDDIFPKIQQLTNNKADLVNGVIPLTQIPLKLRDDSQLNINMADLTSEIVTMVNSSTDYLLAEQERKVEEHMFADDPHLLKPYIDQAVQESAHSIMLEIESLRDNMEGEVLRIINTRLESLSDSSTVNDLLTALRI